MPKLIGIRGAIRVDLNDAELIANATRDLLVEIQRRNALTPDAVVSGLFTMTPDLDADFPARAARELGWSDVALLGAQESAIPGAMDRMIRVLLHAWLDGPPHHVYLGEAASLRPDRSDPAEETAGAAGAAGTALIVGLGLIGSSVGLALKRHGLFDRLLGLDVEPSAAELAHGRGAVDAIVPSIEQGLETASAVLLCVPTDRIPELVDRCGVLARPGTCVFDTGSSKAAIVEAMNRLPSAVRAVGMHPIAGSERSGPGAARSDLFKGHRWILTQTQRTDGYARGLAEAVVSATGAEAEWLDADAHDSSAVATIQLSYLLSVALASHFGRDAGPSKSLVGPGARSMLRLARGEPAIMAGLLMPSWERARDEVRQYIRALEGVMQALDTAESTERMADVLATNLPG